MKKIAFFITATFIIGSSFAQQVNTAKLDSLFSILDTNKKAMGSFAISKNGTLLYSKSIGFIDANQTIAANSNTKYHIGSISKMFTAVIVFQLIEAKKLSLDTKLDKYFATIPNANKITIGNMLNHNTGIFNITNDSLYENWCSNPISQKEMVGRIEKYPSDFEPGSKHEYSNSNYILLTYIIEKITGKSYAQNLNDRICKKINLLNTYFGGKINTANNEAISFAASNNVWEKFSYESDMSVPQGAGAIVSTPTDLTLFVQALFAGKLLKPTSLAQMQDIKDGFGMGMFKLPFYNKFTYGHTGGIDGFNSIVGYFKEDSITVSACCNAMNYDFNNITIGLLSCIYDKPYKLPNFTVIVTKDLDFTKLIGVYSTAKFPLKITISTDGKSITAQATGQSAFPLEYNGNNTFRFEAAGIELTFDVEKQQMTLMQGGRSFVMDKEK
jgi:D-alanyl-D-alanine carboxypeptidase